MLDQLSKVWGESYIAPPLEKEIMHRLLPPPRSPACPALTARASCARSYQEIQFMYQAPEWEPRSRAPAYVRVQHVSASPVGGHQLDLPVPLWDFSFHSPFIHAIPR